MFNGFRRLAMAGPKLIFLVVVSSFATVAAVAVSTSIAWAGTDVQALTSTPSSPSGGIGWWGVIGAALILIGCGLLILVDVPRRALRRLGDLKLHSALGRGNLRARRSRSGTPQGEPQQSQIRNEAYAGLAPGWYLDQSDPNSARYWDGTTLSAESRPTGSLQSPSTSAAPAAPAPPAAPSTSHDIDGVAAYRGLEPGWYRDPRDPTSPLYWDGTTLSADGPSTQAAQAAEPAPPPPPAPQPPAPPPPPAAAFDSGNGSQEQDPFASYRGLEPGWYRDPREPTSPRYWDGTTLSADGPSTQAAQAAESAPPPPPAPQPPAPPPPPAAAFDSGNGSQEQDPFASYRGLEPGWYRDPREPTSARYWDGTTLSAESRSVAAQQPR